MLPTGVKFYPFDVELLEHLAEKFGVGNEKPHLYIDMFILRASLQRSFFSSIHFELEEMEIWQRRFGYHIGAIGMYLNKLSCNFGFAKIVKVHIIVRPKFVSSVYIPYVCNLFRFYIFALLLLHSLNFN